VKREPRLRAGCGFSSVKCDEFQTAPGDDADAVAINYSGLAGETLFAEPGG
jgi:hypothetical protein